MRNGKIVVSEFRCIYVNNEIEFVQLRVTAPRS